MEIQIIDGFKCYDPELAVMNDDFESRCFPLYEKYAGKNFWYWARNRVIGLLVNKYSGGKPTDFLEVGCGNGFVTGHLKKLSNLKNDACDIYLEALKYSKKRNPDVNLFQYNLFKGNLEKQYDFVGCFDVLEHIEEDEKAIENLYGLVKKDGFLIVTVPVNPELWSMNDVINKHKRRYKKGEMVAKLKKAGFKIEYQNHFMRLLYPLFSLTRKMQKGKNESQEDVEKMDDTTLTKLLNLKVNPIVNFGLEMIMGLEVMLMKTGMKFGKGSSIVVVAKK